MTSAAIESGIWDVDAKAYHADASAISHSAMEKFRISPFLYWSLYIGKTLPFDEPTASMRLGTALHAWLLEPDKFDALIAIEPEGDGRKKEVREARESVRASGKTVISADQHVTMLAMAEGVKRNGMAADLLSAVGRSELSIRWTDENSGLQLKARFDRVLDCGVAIDLKTAVDPRPPNWARQASSLGYHRSAEHYLRGWRAAGDMHPNLEYLHVLVGNEPPHDCSIVCLDAAALEIGQRENAADLARLQWCFESDNWSSPYANDINRVSLPKYYQVAG